MKTAISIPDDIFIEADTLATKLGVSRSELFATAMAKMLAYHRDKLITAKLNAVYENEKSTLDPVVAKMQALSIEPEDW